MQDICFWFVHEMLELKKHLALFSAFKPVSFFFFSIFLTLLTLYFEVVHHIYKECTKSDKKVLIRFHCSFLNNWEKCWWWICFLIRFSKFWNRWKRYPPFEVRARVTWTINTKTNEILEANSAFYELIFSKTPLNC